MSNTPGVSWTTVLSRGATKKVVSVNSSRQSAESGLIPEILFEDEDLKNALLIQRATAIVQQALTSNSVLFSFPKKLFEDRVQAYKLIEAQISAKMEFLPISMYSTRADSELLIQANFDDNEDRGIALLSGVAHNGVVYKAVASNTSVNGNSSGLTHVQFTLLHSVSRQADFLVKLLDSLAYYGKVYQVKKYTRKGYFEGKMSVILDTSEGYIDDDCKTVPAQALSRNLYLHAWDCYAVASFINAPAVCHFCRLSGHLRSACPQLASRKCFGCHELGHTARFCKNKPKRKVDVSEEEELDQYMEASQATASTKGEGLKKDLTPDTPVSATKGSTVNKDLTEAKSLDKDSMLQDEDTASDPVDLDMGDANDNKASSSKERVDLMARDGSQASKYAPYATGYSMKIDSPREMLAMSKVSDSTKAKVNATKKTVSPSGNRVVKKVVSTKTSSSGAHRA